MENTFVKFYYGTDVQKYKDNWKEQFEGGIFFDTLNRQIYYNGEPYGKSITDSDLSDITTTLSKLDTAFVSVDTQNEDKKEGNPASLIIEFTNFGGDTTENVKIPIMSDEAYNNDDIIGGLISREDWNKLNSIDLSTLVYKGDSGLLTQELKDLLNDDIVNNINEILIDGVKLEPIIDPSTGSKTKKVNIPLSDAISDAVSDIVSSVYIYQGSLDSMEKLRNITNPTKGHVYNLLFSSEEYGAMGVNVAWDGEQWDSLGGIFSTSDISGDISDLLTQVGTVETNLGITNNNVSNLSKIVELMNSDASTDLDGDDNLTNEQKYSISYKIDNEILNALKWTEIN